MAGMKVKLEEFTVCVLFVGSVSQNLCNSFHVTSGNCDFAIAFVNTKYFIFLPCAQI